MVVTPTESSFSQIMSIQDVLNQGGEPSSIWPCFHFEKNSLSTALSSLGRMLTDGIHTDITINTSDGSIAAHRAILAASSPVFRSMFSQLKEEELSIVNIFDVIRGMPGLA